MCIIGLDLRDYIAYAMILLRAVVVRNRVDEGVFDKVPFEMALKTDWRFLIGHMLGVDHCGHTGEC